MTHIARELLLLLSRINSHTQAIVYVINRNRIQGQ